LLSFLSSDIVARGDTPFLHVSSKNERAVRLYQQNGYRARTTIAFTSLQSTRAVHDATLSESTLEITPWSLGDRDSFRELNLAWLRRYFHVEPHDLEQLEHPETILDEGGEIFMARAGGAVVGTCALIHLGGGRFELAKLSVDDQAQRHGIGRALCDRAIRRFKERGGVELILQTSTKLAAAVRLYRRLGFVEYEPPERAEYERSNLFMRYAP
jgi:ribosomal protein S18 acetylase RimI-like enzyme